MNIALIPILLLLAGLLLRKGKPEGFFYGFAFLAIFLRFAAEKMFPRQGNQIMSDFLRTGGVLFVVLTGLLLSTRKLMSERFFHLVSIACGYVILAGTLRSVTNQYLSLYTTFISFCFFLVVLFVLRDRLQLKVNEVVRFSVYIGIFQALMGIVQYYAPPSLLPAITLERYSSNGSGAIDLGLVDMEVGTPVQGTLNRFNTFGNFQAYVFLLHCGYTLLYRQSRKIKDVLIAGLLGYSVFLSGNRASVLSLVGGILLLLFYYKRTVFVFATVLFAIFFTSMNVFINKVVADGVQSSTNPLERLMSAFVVFKGTGQLEQSGSTLFYSYSLLPDFINNLFFGGGKYYKEGYQFVGAKSGVTIFDTTIMTLLTEFGIIGFVLLMLPYIYIFKWTRRHFKHTRVYPLLLASMILFLLQTITDPGIFGIDATYLFGMLLMGIYVEHKQMRIKATVRPGHAVTPYLPGAN